MMVTVCGLLVSVTGWRYGKVKGSAGVALMVLLDALIVPPLFSVALTDVV